MRTMIAIPCMDEMDSGFVQCLVNLRKVGDVDINILSGSLVYEARERLAGVAVDGGYDYVLWLDSDMMFPETLLLDLLAQDKDFITGVCAARRPPYNPCIFRSNGEKLDFVTDFKDRLIKVDGCGFGVVLMKTELLQKSFDKYRTCFQPIPGYGEDLSFCVRAKDLGYQLFADPNIEIGHIGKTVITKNAFRRYDAKQSKTGIEDNNGCL